MSLLNRKKEFWKKFENSIIEIIELAIDLFKEKESLPRKEDDLNRTFFSCLIEANYLLQKENRGQPSAPMYEANNQPKFEEGKRTIREFKRPDFQWSIMDILEPDPLKSSKQFVLECKRLGLPNGNWVFNENYVNHGIKRFVSKEHGYAYGVESSAMLGYVQDMDIYKILSEVNVNIESINQKSLSETQKKDITLHLSHILKLEYSEDAVRLIHLWIDLRKFY